MKRLVYGASTGSYSDYSVSEVLFEREEDRDDYYGPFDQGGYDGPHKEEFLLVDKLTPKTSGMRLAAWVWEDGSTYEGYKHDNPGMTEWHPGVDGTDQPVEHTLTFQMGYLNGRQVLMELKVEGLDVARTAKVFSERRAYILANHAVLAEEWKANQSNA